VKAHGAVIRAANAAKERLVTGSSGGVNVDELARGVSNQPERVSRARRSRERRGPGRQALQSPLSGEGGRSQLL